MEPIPISEPIGLPIRREPTSFRSRLRSCAESGFLRSVCTLRNAASAALGAASVALAWTTIRAADALGFRIHDEGPSTAVAAGIVVGGAGGAMSTTIGAFALHISRIVPIAFHSPFALPFALGAGMFVGSIAGGGVAYHRWRYLDDFLDGMNSLPPTLSSEGTEPYASSDAVTLYAPE